MKKGFTLIELIIVIIIVGVLAILGLSQYRAAIERSRGAEAAQVISELRSNCAGIWMRNGTTAQCIVGNLGISTSADPIVGEMPGTNAGAPGGGCWPTNYFRYTINVAGAADSITFRAIRCTAGGKAPNAGGVANAKYLQLAINYATGVDTWTSVGGY